MNAHNPCPETCLPRALTRVSPHRVPTHLQLARRRAARAVATRFPSALTRGTAPLEARQAPQRQHGTEALYGTLAVLAVACTAGLYGTRAVGCAAGAVAGQGAPAGRVDLGGALEERGRGGDRSGRGPWGGGGGLAEVSVVGDGAGEGGYG